MLALGDSWETLHSRNDLRKDEQPEQQNTCRAGQNTLGWQENPSLRVIYLAG